MGYQVLCLVSELELEGREELFQLIFLVWIGSPSQVELVLKEDRQEERAPR